MGLFIVLLFLALILVVNGLNSPIIKQMTIRRHSTSHFYRTGDEEMDILLRTPDVELLEYILANITKQTRWRRKKERNWN